MAELLTTLGVSHEIEDIIIKAEKKLVLISPYLQLSNILKQRLLDASKRGVEIVMVYGKKDLKSDEKDFLFELTNFTLYYLENLHAKCYYNESKMVVTSMNLYEFSERNNREIGIFIKKEKNNKLYNSSLRECQSIIRASKLIKNIGYCIRCKKEISYNSEAPFCKKCYRVWVKYEDSNYTEKYCHSCSAQYYRGISFNSPLCKKCH